MKKINNKVLTIAIAILTLLSVGGIATAVTAPGGVAGGDPGTLGGG